MVQQQKCTFSACGIIYLDGQNNNNNNNAVYYASYYMKPIGKLQLGTLRVTPQKWFLRLCNTNHSTQFPSSKTSQWYPDLRQCHHYFGQFISWLLIFEKKIHLKAKKTIFFRPQIIFFSFHSISSPLPIPFGHHRPVLCYPGIICYSQSYTWPTNHDIWSHVERAAPGRPL